MTERPPSHVAEPVSDGVASASGPEEEGIEEDVPVGLTHQLRFEQFKNVATLSVAAAGGTLALFQAGYIKADAESSAVVVAFALAAALALLGQDKLLDGLEAGRGRTRASRWFLGLALAVFGAGVGMLLSIMFRTPTP